MVHRLHFAAFVADSAKHTVVLGLVQKKTQGNTSRECFKAQDHLTDAEDYFFHLTSHMAANTYLIYSVYVIVLHAVVHCNHSTS